MIPDPLVAEGAGADARVGAVELEPESGESSPSPGTKAPFPSAANHPSPLSPGTKAEEVEPETNESPPSPGTKTEEPEPDTSE